MTTKSRSPSSWSLMAAHRPANPAPMIRWSTSFGSLMCLTVLRFIEQTSIRCVREHDHTQPAEPCAAARTAPRPRGPAAREPVPRRALHRPARRGGRHLARPALPLLRQQDRVPRGRRPARRRRPDRADRAASGRRAAGPAPGLGRGVRRLRDSRTSRATCRWYAAPPGATTRSAGSTTRYATCWTTRIFLEDAQGELIADTPRNRLIVRGWSAMTEELVIAWRTAPGDVTRDDLLAIITGALPVLIDEPARLRSGVRRRPRPQPAGRDPRGGPPRRRPGAGRGGSSSRGCPWPGRRGP